MKRTSALPPGRPLKLPLQLDRTWKDRASRNGNFSQAYWRWQFCVLSLTIELDQYLDMRLCSHFSSSRLYSIFHIKHDFLLRTRMSTGPPPRPICHFVSARFAPLWNQFNFSNSQDEPKGESLRLLKKKPPKMRYAPLVPNLCI